MPDNHSGDTRINREESQRIEYSKKGIERDQERISGHLINLQELRENK